MRKLLLFFAFLTLLSACSSNNDDTPISPVEFVTVDKTTLGLSVGNSEKLVGTVNPKEVLATKTWTSSSVGIASVSKSGEVTAVSAGTARITFKADDKTASCMVTVGNVPAELIMLNNNVLSVLKSSITILSVHVLPEEAVSVVLWTSSDPTVATVASDGTVKALNVGTTTITASVDGKSATCAVTVMASTPSLSIDFAYGALVAVDDDSYPGKKTNFSMINVCLGTKDVKIVNEAFVDNGGYFADLHLFVTKGARTLLDGLYELISVYGDIPGTNLL